MFSGRMVAKGALKVAIRQPSSKPEMAWPSMVLKKDRVVVGHGRFFHHYGRTAFFFLENRDCGAICFSVVIDGEIDFLILLVAVTDSDQRKAAYASVFVGRRVVDQMAIQVAKLQGAEILVEAFGISLVVERRIVDFFCRRRRDSDPLHPKRHSRCCLFIEEAVADEIRCAGERGVCA